MAQIQLSYSAAEIDAAIGKINSLITIVDYEKQIAQLYNGSDAIYPRTRAEAIFFDDDPNKNLESVLTSYFSSGSLYTGIAEPNTIPETPAQSVFWLVFEPGLYENFLVESYGDTLPLEVSGPGVISWDEENETWVFEAFNLSELGEKELVFGSLDGSQFLDENSNPVIPSGVQLYIDKSTNKIYRWGNRSFVLLSGEGGGSFTQIQADWDESDPNSVSFIRNKPTIPEGAVLDDEVTPNGTQAVKGSGIYAALEPLKEKIDALDAQLNPYVLTLKVSPTLIKYTGSSRSATFTANFKKNNIEQSPDNIVITCGNDVSVSPAKTLVVSRTNRGSYSGSVSASLNGKSYSVSNVSFKIMNALRIGFNPSSDSITAAVISSLNEEDLKNSVSGTYVIDNLSTGNYLWICCDDSLSISSVKSGGFEVPMHKFNGQSYITVNGYKCYRSESQVNMGNNKEYTLS